MVFSISMMFHSDMFKISRGRFFTNYVRRHVFLIHIDNIYQQVHTVQSLPGIEKSDIYSIKIHWRSFSWNFSSYLNVITMHVINIFSPRLVHVYIYFKIGSTGEWHPYIMSTLFERDKAQVLERCMK